MTGKGLLSLRHAGYLAGLGVIGKNRMLNNPQYGNLIKLGAVITDAELDGDPILEHTFCKDRCKLCIKNCPSAALSEEAVNQKKCRLNHEGLTAKGASITICYNCRMFCPFRAGWSQ
ncbi:MAG: hypothetical protein FWG49_05880, partial [Leptospirales bacterium]|nr:hypothetical protein [Leptospirales bacterium]